MNIQIPDTHNDGSGELERLEWTLRRNARGKSNIFRCYYHVNLNVVENQFFDQKLFHNFRDRNEILN